MNPHGGQWMQFAITAIVVAVVLAIRLRRMRNARRLRLETLWIVPALFAVLTVWLFSAAPPHGSGWAWIVAALALGGAIGWQRGRLMRINVDPVTHELNQQVSPAAMIFLVALIGIRIGLKALMAEEGQAWHLDVALVTDAFVAFALGLLSMTRLEMFLRARAMLNRVRAGAIAPRIED